MPYVYKKVPKAFNDCMKWINVQNVCNVCKQSYAMYNLNKTKKN